jgi:hypothetical protein
MIAVLAISAAQGTGPMAKAMSIAGLIVGGLITLTFALDLLLTFPFDRAMPMMDIGFMVCGGVLAYLSWNAMRDVK